MAFLRLLGALVVSVSLSFAAVPCRAEQILVLAAASLQESLTEAADNYAKMGHERPKISFAASSALARQVENGVPAALFISADEAWMHYLAQKDLIVTGTRQSFLSNRIVLIAPAAQTFQIKIKNKFPLAQALNGGKLAMADPDSVPAGRYGKAALENLGVWRDVEDSVVRGENVRAALAFVERGEARAGIVYATDAAVAKNIVVVDTFPEISHPPISYPLAIIAGHDTPDARAFREFLLSEGAKSIFRKYGFVAR